MGGALFEKSLPLSPRKKGGCGARSQARRWEKNQCQKKKKKLHDFVGKAVRQAPKGGTRHGVWEGKRCGSEVKDLPDKGGKKRVMCRGGEGRRREPE